MKIVVLGAGMQGTACAYDLITSEGIDAVLITDQDIALAEKAAQRIKTLSGKSIQTSAINVNNPHELINLLSAYDVVVSAVPYFLNLKITQAAIETKTHMVDMGGNTDLVFEQRELHQKAIENGVTILPDCGLAPGLANMIASYGIHQFDTVDSVKIRVGGLPQYPVPPLNYQLFFSIHGLINEYIGNAVILKNGQQKTVPTLTELETVQLDSFGHKLEAAITLGGLSTLPWTYEGQIKNLDYKTLRYPGHWEMIQAMESLGLFDESTIDLNGQHITPRQITTQQMEKSLNYKNLGGRIEDIVLVKIEITGKQNGQNNTHIYELVDYYDPTTELTAMMRCTAFPVSIVAQMLGNGSIQQTGVLTLEETVDGTLLIEALKKRNICIEQKELKPLH